MSSPHIPESALATMTVHLDAIIDNYQTLKSQSKSADCAAVVKANAYGLGAEHVAPALYHDGGCEIFFVANLAEAVQLRGVLPDAIIYVFNGVMTDQVDTVIDHKIRPVLNDLSQIETWKSRTEPCAIHFDTGINRLGLSGEEAEQLFMNKPELNVSLVMSHFIQSEIANHPSNEMQLDRFMRVRFLYPDAQASLCNSGGIYLGSDFHFDLLRPGIMLYGGNPGLPSLPDGIRHAVELHGKILQIRYLTPGMAVGYNSQWTAAEDARVALVNVGYADGTFKTSDKQAKVFVGGHIAPVIGKVSMDMIAIDITDDNFNHVNVNDDVELLGANITLEMVAEVSTLGQYELLTGTGQRYNKKYTRGA